MNTKSRNATQDAVPLAAQAASKKQEGRFKEAIELFKRALKQTENREWRQALAECYLSRALAFGKKGMPKEAAALWENHADHLPPSPEAYARYIGWLLQAGQTAKAKAALSRLSGSQLDQQHPAFAAALGLVMLTVQPELREAVPDDSAFMAHLALAEQALGALRSDDRQAAEAALNPLPFRSAFRDLRTLMKGALSMGSAPDQALELLKKVPGHSPYSPAAKLLITSTRDGADLVREMLELDQRGRKFVTDFRGFDKERRELLETLHKQKGRLSDKVRFSLALQFRNLLGEEAVKRYCHAALLDYPAGLRDFSKHFGPLGEFEEQRLNALKCERDRDFHGANCHWNQCLLHLDPKNRENALSIALILRHMADRAPEDSAVQWLMESLEFDPDDRGTYLQILDHHQRLDPGGPAYSQWLDRALAVFAGDVEFLTLAIKAATRKKAFKKAAQNARALLEVDPVNSFAKRILFGSHLAHGRKLLKAKKFHLVEKEIDQAETLALGKHYQARALLMRGLFHFAGENPTLGSQLMKESLEALYDEPACARFHLALESRLLDLPAAMAIVPAPARGHLLSPEALLRLVDLFREFAEESHKQRVLLQALTEVEGVIQRSLQRRTYPEETLLALCRCLADIGHLELLRHCVAGAYARWPKPIWQYYMIYCQVGGKPKRCGIKELYQLQQSLEQARRDRDDRAAALIGQFLQRHEQACRPMGEMESDYFDDELADDDEGDGILVDLFGHLPRATMEMITEKMTRIMAMTPPDQLMKQVQRFVNKERGLFAAALDEPDLFTVLLVLKAAKDLGIDTGVTLQEVRRYFGLDGNSNASSFPFF